MNTHHPHDPHEHGRRLALREGAFLAAMQGGGENYLSAFALWLHASTLQIGLLSALPQLIGTWAQLASLKIMSRVDRRGTLVSLGAAGQALTWLPLLALPLMFPSGAPWLLLACAVLYYLMGHVTVPAWNSLITDFIDPDGRGLYFSRRHRIIAIVSFLTLCVAGLVLHATAVAGLPAAGFAAIFLAAAIARGGSAYVVSRLDEGATARTRETTVRLLAYLRDERGHNLRWFMAFSCLMHLSVMIAGPYFVVYLLRDLQFSYLQYTGWLAAGLFGQLISLQRWGKVGDRFGNKKVLWVTGITVPVVPTLYLMSDNFYFLSVVSFAGGLIWAGLSLALQNYVFDVVEPEDRGKSVALLNSVNALGWFAGAMLGSTLAEMLPAATMASSLPLVFFISGVLRLAVSLTLLPKFREGRRVEPITARGLLTHLPVIKPLSQALGIK